MRKIYSKSIIKIPNKTTDKYLLILKSFADIFYTACETLSPDQMKPITKIIMENVRKLSCEELSMSFAKNKVAGDYALFIFDHKPDGVLRTVQKDDIGFYVEV